MDTKPSQTAVVKYGCPVEVTLQRIGGKWKSAILWWLRQHPKSFGELKHLIPGISAKILTQQLRELEADDLIQRVAYREMPRRVDYAVTTSGTTLRPIIELMCEWGKTHMPAFASGTLNLTGLTVLIVSAQRDHARQTELAACGVQVAIATSASAALATFADIQPPALIVDTNLPDGQAYSLIRQVKELASAADRPIATIALTAAENTDDRRKALRAGYQVCLPKPVDTTALVASLASLVGFFTR